MLLAILVSVILTLLGVSFLMMAQTENLIAENEMLASQALYAGEAGARAVKRWFDRPGVLAPLDFPLPAEVDRTLRMIDEDGAGPNPPVAATAAQRYKAGVDRDGDGKDDIFRFPYRGHLTDTLLGTEAGPDMRIVNAAFLEALSRKLFATYPDEAAGLVARITAIDVYAPPYLETLGGWARFGMGTVKVTVRIIDDGEILAERTVRAVLNEAPYPGPYGPLHSGAGLTFRTAAGPPTVYWGAMSAMEDVDISTIIADYPESLPRGTGGLPQIDPLWGLFTSSLGAYKSRLPSGSPLGDPWFRLLTAGVINDFVESIPHIAGDSSWRDWDGIVPPPPEFVDRSHAVHKQFVICPLYDYETWRMIATSGDLGVRYFAHAGGQNFRENGRGTAVNFRAATHGQSGIFFFDTTDGRPPLDDGTNLTPDIVIDGGNWNFEGVLYLNARKFQTRGNPQGVDVGFVAPGEPYQDLNQNGKHDPEDEAWIDLSYPSFLGDAFTAAGHGTRAAAAPVAITARASLRGVLYTNGKFEATGQARHYGSIIARGGVVQEEGSAGTPEIYFDAALLSDWPRAGTDLPRVVITRWLTDS